MYQYYAALEREREDADTRPVPDAPWTVAFKTLTGRRHQIVGAHEPHPTTTIDNTTFPTGKDAEKRGLAQGHTTTVGSPDDGSMSEEEKLSAYRIMRVASWQIVFYLITTDILGFSSSPYAFQQLGFGPGVLVYTFFFLLAFAGGQVLWRLYMSMDSEKFPITCYADLGERTFGKFVRHFFNILQSLQLVFNVAILIIGCGTKLATIIKYKFCYIALCVFWALLGMIAGQIKSFRNFAWFTNINIWLNLALMIIVMAASGVYDPVPSQSGHDDLSEPKILSGWVPEYTKTSWYLQVQGVQLAVFAYGGAMIFTEFMAEMRRPRDFWKAALCGQAFCYVMYMLFGLFVYGMQGQYTAILPTLNFDNYPIQLVCNIIGLTSTAIATVLYANVGVKLIYHNILRTYFRAPTLSSKRGSYLWSILVIFYWAIAWVIGSAIPNISALSTLIGAACILQFTYTFPPLLLLGWWMQKDACEGDRPWEPGMAKWQNRVDTWRQGSRWKRGLKKHWYVKVFLFLLFLSSLSLCGLGMYAGIEGAIEAYAKKATTAYSCRAPGQPKDS